MKGPLARGFSLVRNLLVGAESMRSMPCLAVLAVVAMASCVPVQQQAQQTPPAFPGPRLEAHDFVSIDGAKLALQQWAPSSGDPWAVIIGVHGMNDDSNAFDLAGPYWAKDGILTIAYDQRGFGRSPNRGIWAGDMLLVHDLRTLTALARARYPRAIVAVAGESLGASVAIEAFAAATPPDADRVVLLSPAVWGWSTQPFAYKTALWLGAHVDPGGVVKPKWVNQHRPESDNVAELRRRDRDPYQSRATRADALYGLVRSMQRASDELGQVRIPVAYLMGAHDQIIPGRAMTLAARALKPSDRSAFYAKGWHLLLIDQQRDTVFDDVESFIRDPAAPLPSGAPIVPGSRTARNEPSRRAALQPVAVKR
jgi:alpha-beta hydrolase superfamily lysophospholipase